MGLVLAQKSERRVQLARFFLKLCGDCTDITKSISHVVMGKDSLLPPGCVVPQMTKQEEEIGFPATRPEKLIHLCSSHRDNEWWKFTHPPC